MRWLAPFLERLLVVLFALFFLQIPLFMQQYQNQLAGRIAELSWQVDHIQAAAQSSNQGSNRSAEAYVRKFKSSPDPDFAEQGKMMELILKRFKKLSRALQGLKEGTALSRPYYFITRLQWDAAYLALSSFTPGIPLSAEGAIYAFLGMAFGYLLSLSLRTFSKA